MDQLRFDRVPVSASRTRGSSSKREGSKLFGQMMEDVRERVTLT